jgi:MurNAc alpha-1-phosphate uridylyltransferase
MSLCAAILAGGIATRLRPITKTIPKALVEVAGQPFIDHQLQLLRKCGYRRVVLCIGYLGEMIEAHLGDGSGLGMEISYAYDGESLRGTGGALLNALPLLGESFLVLYGDSYLPCDYQEIEDAFLGSGKRGLMTVHKNANLWDKSNIIFADGKIILYDKRFSVPEMQYIDYGLGALRADVLKAYPADTYLDLADIYMSLVQRKELAGYEMKERFYEIGTKAGLKETEEFIKNTTDRDTAR